jgi:hypothetical protein
MPLLKSCKFSHEYLLPRQKQRVTAVREVKICYFLCTQAHRGALKLPSVESARPHISRFKTQGDGSNPKGSFIIEWLFRSNTCRRWLPHNPIRTIPSDTLCLCSCEMHSAIHMIFRISCSLIFMYA